MPEPAYETRPLREDERDWLSEGLPERVGVATYVVEDGRAELVTLDALREGAGVGRRLIEAASTR